jgi:hypothetical protein
MISFVFKMIKILIFVCSSSYFFAMAFKYLIDLQSDFLNWGRFRPSDVPEITEDHFLLAYEMEDMSDYDSMLRLIYFSFTSLTTVGFGDFNPKSNAERVFIAFGLLFGVAIFSYIMSEAIEMIDQYKKSDANDEGI